MHELISIERLQMTRYLRFLFHILIMLPLSNFGCAQNQLVDTTSTHHVFTNMDIELNGKQQSPDQEYRIFLSSKTPLTNMRIISVSNYYLTVQGDHSPDSFRIRLGSVTGIKDEYYLQQQRGNLARRVKFFAISGAVLELGDALYFGASGGVDPGAYLIWPIIGSGVGTVAGWVFGSLENTIRYHNQSVLFRRLGRYTNEEKQAIIQAHILDKQNP